MNRRKIAIVAYDKRWPSIFEAEKTLLASMLGELAVKVEHIGSTSVPQLSAKPIIDILIEVTAVEALDKKVRDFACAGYKAMGENGIPGRRFYQKGGNNRTHHIHAFCSGSLGLFRHRAFRDYLISHPEIAKEYAGLKEKAALACAHDSDLYMALKNEFILKHEKLAMEQSHLIKPAGP